MKLPRVGADKVVRVLEKKGFRLARQSGSHKVFRNDAGVRVTVPFHTGKSIHPKILKSIMRDAELKPEDF